jgi:hypothetical protein
MACHDVDIKYYNSNYSAIDIDHVTRVLVVGGAALSTVAAAASTNQKLVLDFDNFGRVGDVISFAQMTLECDEHADLNKYRVLEYAEQGAAGGDDWSNLLSVHIATEMPTRDLKLIADTLLDSLRQLMESEGGTVRLIASDPNGYIVDYALPAGQMSADGAVLPPERAFQRVLLSQRGCFTVTFTTRDIASLTEAKRNAIVQSLKELKLK